MVEPVAFMSYAHDDDTYNHGKITELRNRLATAVSFFRGESFEIFQDSEHIRLGQPWEEMIDQSIDSVLLFIPIITPNFLKSAYCRKEFQRFLERERKLGRNDLIIPIYYATCDEIEDSEYEGDKGKIVRVLDARQRDDWREIRQNAISHPVVDGRIEKLAEGICQIIKSNLEMQAEGERGTTPTVRTTEEEGQGSGPVLIVAPEDPNAYPTIGEAITAAAPGSRILIRPGLYIESVGMGKPLELVGATDSINLPVVQSEDAPALTVRTSDGRVSRLGFRRQGDGATVDIAAGGVRIEHCDITGRGRACVDVRDQAAPVLVGNYVHNGAGCGVVIRSRAQGHLEGNDIECHAEAGVLISHFANPTLRGNRIHGGRKSGVAVTEHAGGTLEDNDITRNEYAGVIVSNDGDPTVRLNRITSNGWSGVCVYERGKGRFDRNDLRGNAQGAWDIAPGCERLIWRGANNE